MRPEQTIHPAARIRTACLCGVFVLFIWLPALDWAFHLDHTPVSNEKRVMAGFPQYRGFEQLKEYLAGFEGYFNDHFGFRKLLIHTNNHWKRQLFRDTPNERVLVGPHGWLFTTGMRVLDNYLGVAPFTTADMEAWRKLVEQRRDWVTARGGHYLFVIAPDKHTIYPEELPEWLSRLRNPTKAERFIAYMKAHSTVEAFDLRQTVADAKPLGVLYLKTDTHWNNLGAFVGYQGLVQLLSRQLPGLKPLQLDAFVVQPVDAPGGDQSDVLGGGAREPQQVALIPRPPLQSNSLVNASARLQEKGTLQPVVMTSTNCNASLGRLVLFHDSFGRPWRSLLAYHFKEVVSVWQHHWNTEFLEREKPVVVIDEFVERFFNTLDPRDLANKDALAQSPK